jgi:glycosidase
MRAIAVALVCSGCASALFGDDAPGDDDVPPDVGTVPIRSCSTRFAYQATGAVAGVELAAEWNWDAREPLADTGGGAYVLDKDLAPGLYAYKLVITRPGGAVDWILDPANSYRTYDGGVENSAVRVPDCTAPLVEVGENVVADGAATVKLRMFRGKDGSEIDRITVARRFENAESEITELERKDGDLTVTLTDLAPGKHVLAVELADKAGATSERVLVPFWIEPEKFDWRDALIYMVMTDRFRNGDPANDPGRDPAAVFEADFRGGDLRGITQALEDGTFDALGVRALWLSPFVENARRVHDDQGHGVSAYHGYWPVKARAIDPRLGTEADLDALVTAAHRRGIRVLMDYVINHVHEDHEYFAAHPDWFRVGCVCGTSGCDWTERRLDCSFRTYMPDVDWQNRDAGEQMISDALWWLERFDLDGLRVDAVKHVEDLAVFDLRARVAEKFERGGTEYFLLGETAMGWRGDNLADNLPEYETISRYVGDDALSGQFDFVLYHATASRVWADDNKGMLHLDFWTKASLEQYPTSSVMTPFVGSHDSERLISLATYGSGSQLVHHKWADQGLPDAPGSQEPYDRVAIALAWTLTVPGAPLLYYGDEYGEHGGADPDNRHMWVAPAQRSPRQTSLHERVARAGTLRKELAPLRRGTYASLTVTEDVLSFARILGNDHVIVVINRSGSPRTQQIAAPFPDATLVDRMDPAGRTAMLINGTLSIDMPARSVAILVPSATP